MLFIVIDGDFKMSEILHGISFFVLAWSSLAGFLVLPYALKKLLRSFQGGND